MRLPAAARPAADQSLAGAVRIDLLADAPGYRNRGRRDGADPKKRNWIMDRKQSLFAALADYVLSRLTPRRAARQETLRRAQNRLDWARSRGHWAGSDKVGGVK